MRNNRHDFCSYCQTWKNRGRGERCTSARISFWLPSFPHVPNSLPFIYSGFEYPFKCSTNVNFLRCRLICPLPVSQNRRHYSAFNFAEVLPLLHARFQTVMFICHSSRWRESEYCMWRVQEAYMELLAASWFTECPGCEKDVSLIEDDDF